MRTYRAGAQSRFFSTLTHVYAQILSETMKLINYLITGLSIGFSVRDKICNHAEPLISLQPEKL